MPDLVDNTDITWSESSNNLTGRPERLNDGTNVVSAAQARSFIDSKGAASGLASLDSDARLADAQTNRLIRMLTRQEFVIAWDDFNRANGALNDTSPSGHTWDDSILGAGAEIVSNQVQFTSTGGSVIDASENLVSVSCDFYTRIDNRQYVVVNLVDANNYLAVRQNGGSLNLFKNEAGSFSQIATGASFEEGRDSRHTVTVRSIAQSGGSHWIQGLFEGKHCFTYQLSAGEQSTFGAATKHGIYQLSSDTATRLDNFVIESVSL